MTYSRFFAAVVLVVFAAPIEATAQVVPPPGATPMPPPAAPEPAPPSAAPEPVAPPPAPPAQAPYAPPAQAPYPPPAQAPYAPPSAPPAQAPYAPPAYAYPQPIAYATPAPRGPNRKGFTAETSLGLGTTLLAPADGEGESFGSIAGLDLGVGGFLNPNLALTLRIAGTTYFVEVDDDLEPLSISNTFLGPSLQYWVNDRLFVGGGLGFGIHDDRDGDPTEEDSGVGVDARVGYGLVVSRLATLFLSTELTTSLLDRGAVTGLGVKLGLQLF